MLSRRPSNRGFTLVEMAVVLAIIGLILALAIPAYQTWLLNLRVRDTTESLAEGLRLARAEAIKRNTTVRFMQVDTLSNSCVNTDSARNWVVARDLPESACGSALSETSSPRLIRKWQASSNSNLVSVSHSRSNGCVAFSGLGLARDCTSNDVIDLSLDVGIDSLSCQADGGDIRCLRVAVLSGGLIKVCDPAASDSPLACS